MIHVIVISLNRDKRDAIKTHGHIQIAHGGRPNEEKKLDRDTGVIMFMRTLRISRLVCTMYGIQLNNASCFQLLRIEFM